MSPKNIGRPIPASVESTHDGPQTGDTGPTKARKPRHVLTDQDRARSAEARKRQYVETSLLCDNCYADGSCKSFQQGAVCALEPLFRRLPTRDTQGVIAKLKEIIATSEERAFLNLHFEKLDGGKAKKEVTKMLNNLTEYHLLLARLYQELAPGSGPITLEPGTVLGDIFGPRPNTD